MKYLKTMIAMLSIALLFSCSIKTESSTIAPHPDFKIGKLGIEKALKKEFDFQKLSLGTYMTRKMGKKELGLNLTLQKDDLNSISDSLLSQYSSRIQELVLKNLLHLEDYDYINITFENKKIKDEFTKSTSIKIRKSLK